MNERHQIAAAFIGQSNAMGIGDSLLSPQLPDSTAYEWVFARQGPTGGSGYLKPLRDPMSAYRPQLLRSQSGSNVPAAVLRYKELTGLSTIVSHLAASGTFVLPTPSVGPGGWEPGGTYRETFLIQTKRMLEDNGIERLAWVNLTMGESDGGNHGRRPDETAAFPDGMIVPGAYDSSTGYPNGYPNPDHLPDIYSAYVQFFQEIQTNFPGVKINMNQTGDCRTQGPGFEWGVRQMQLVQEHLARSLPNVYCEMRTTRYFESYGYLQADGVHYTQAGLNYMGRIDGEIMAHH
jgi:hypothetical protein